MANDPSSLQLNLGALRSAMQLTLHTHHAARIWHGRMAGEGRPGIIGTRSFNDAPQRLRPADILQGMRSA
nr:AcaB family transcriptional regulator [Burkholderia glumae]